MTNHNAITAAADHVFIKILGKPPVWAIPSTDDAALVIHAPIPIFSPQSILYTVQRIIDNMGVNKEGEKLE